MTIPSPYAHILSVAAHHAEITPEAAEVVRIGENAVLKARPGVVARIARPGQHAAASREVTVSRWLTDEGIPVVRPLDIDQPTMIDEYAVTWWEEPCAVAKVSASTSACSCGSQPIKGSIT